jgi:16S rRNA (cytidine1402-2'-O)-methyltransferase
VSAAVAAGYPVVPIPGPSAVLAALVSSGLPTNQFTFLGFLPRKRGELERLIRETAAAKRSFVFFESPHRIVKTLDIMASALGPRSLVVAREITKLHEEFLRGTPATLLEHFAKSPPRGELTVVVAGSDWKAPNE